MQRRDFIRGLIGLVAAPAIVRASNLMTIKPLDESYFKYLKPGVYFTEINHSLQIVPEYQVQPRIWRPGVTRGLQFLTPEPVGEFDVHADTTQKIFDQLGRRIRIAGDS